MNQTCEKEGHQWYNDESNEEIYVCLRCGETKVVKDPGHWK